MCTIKYAKTIDKSRESPPHSPSRFLFYSTLSSSSGPTPVMDDTSSRTYIIHGLVISLKLLRDISGGLPPPTSAVVALVQDIVAAVDVRPNIIRPDLITDSRIRTAGSQEQPRLMRSPSGPSPQDLTSHHSADQEKRQREEGRGCNTSGAQAQHCTIPKVSA